eukprot:732808-Pelagomonas_calceolata.AAC.1
MHPLFPSKQGRARNHQQFSQHLSPKAAKVDNAGKFPKEVAVQNHKKEHNQGLDLKFMGALVSGKS